MKSLSKALEESKNTKRQTNSSTEHQIYGVYLGDTLGDPKHYSLYIKLAKTLPRQILDAALTYVKDYPNAKSKGKLFMWRLAQLRSTQGSITK